ncbi:YggS family pyridoxal phosphate-dependent enzyme [Chengkuizengella axinellae]|uniref:Pyridoxal phosphate homeostasis protein n=1 Tax=Chengkuizengella axinellae TaxID=3064388 RepID=A0ABT9IVQ8_9BACL|nr:YggS family pyridoxal phosphate-dependent enzyme [Chengkuizengella sp. 2205SS18-9]MDP5273167.1 YggS family pyridoxal phosphate-dependent enzyme [Chengkuizengella sp. 2205SS18-9]
MDLKGRVREIDSRVQAACNRSNRKREDVEIIAVTKYVSLKTAKDAVEIGCKHIGENRWPDSEEKVNALSAKAQMHFIGHLQSKKVKHIVGRFPYVHSLDRMSLAEEIEKQAILKDRYMNCLIQVNVSGEESKYGISPDELFKFAENLLQFKHINVIGLMTMAPFEEDPEKTRPVFRELRKLRDYLNEKQIFDHKISHLSMGMSNDFEIAIEEGATFIRLGSKLVGKE